LAYCRDEIERRPAPVDGSCPALELRVTSLLIGSVHHGSETSRTLYEMLLPNRLKDGVEMRGNLVLVLDERAARFPWEMLEDRWSKRRRPPSVEHGIIRQLTTQTFREQPSMAMEHRALVIGDPRSDFIPLPGARQEAEAVQAQLVAQGYQVQAQIHTQAHDIITALHGDAYQVLHLAGHGVHRHALDQGPDGPLCNACGQQLPVADEDLVSGMIIGTNMVLTPTDVQQMRRVPELVFINCCHLARTDGGDAGRHGDDTELHRLAANLAVQFIRMGVRGVIAAGWAVDDRAATTFATAFYRHLINGRSFGTAVRMAREQTWNESPNINTWGAYQCYGDPDFTLSGEHDQAGGHANNPAYVSPSEAIADLKNLRADAGSAAPSATGALIERLTGIERRIDDAIRQADQDWRRRGDLAEALGLAHGELGNVEQAVAYINDAVAADDAGATCGAVEHRARFHARWALALYRREEIQQAGKEFDAALNTLTGVQIATNGWLGGERYRSLTGIYSRRVQTLPPKERKPDLEELIAVYDRADTQLRERTGADPDKDPLDLYSRLLWLTAKLMLTAYGKQTLEQLCPDFEQRCTHLAQRARDEGPGNDGGFWSEATAAELRVLQALHHGKLNRQVAAEVTRNLRDAMNRGVSQRQKSSLQNNFDLLYCLSAEATVRQSHFHTQAGMLAGIRDALA
jgi:tetratricopeptide (TPR) repeat protein